ncbi:hypothetical protein AB0C93_03190 [Streptomyces sp. NPDC048518]|uniref:hypothetical protein n=1 Tax=Streptomyces sp. NPDC048518 TaxID=3155029 RepID=UPI0033DBE8C5
MITVTRAVWTMNRLRIAVSTHDLVRRHPASHPASQQAIVKQTAVRAGNAVVSVSGSPALIDARNPHPACNARLRRVRRLRQSVPDLKATAETTFVAKSGRAAATA